MGKSIDPHHSKDSPDDAGRTCPQNRAYSHEGARGDTDGQMFPLSPDLLPDYERAQHHERNPNQIGEHLNEAVITDLRLLGNTTNGSRTEDNRELLAQQGSPNRTFQVPQIHSLRDMTEVRRQNSIDLSRGIDIQSNVVRQGPSRVCDTVPRYPRTNETYPGDEIPDHRTDEVFSEHVISSTSYNATRSHSLGDMDALQRHTAGGITHSQSITEGTLRERPSRLSLPNGRVGVDNGSLAGMVRSDTFATEHNHFELAYMMPQAENNEAGLIGCELLLRFLHSLMIREHIPEPNCILPIRSPVQDNYTIILQHGERLRLLADDFSRSPQRQLVRERAAEVALGSLDLNSFRCIVLSTFEFTTRKNRTTANITKLSDLNPEGTSLVPKVFIFGPSRIPQRLFHALSPTDVTTKKSISYCSTWGSPAFHLHKPLG
uniref:Uncharacterized protein n=1 Tax=Timema shepardi TaxID=629360 RepID=A0A7R9AK79_TIMSH|nr:unnamed protein product [Timema shepardi]